MPTILHDPTRLSPLALRWEARQEPGCWPVWRCRAARMRCCASSARQTCRSQKHHECSQPTKSVVDVVSQSL